MPPSHGVGENLIVPTSLVASFGNGVPKGRQPHLKRQHIGHGITPAAITHRQIGSSWHKLTLVSVTLGFGRLRMDFL